MEDHSRTIIHIDIDCFYAQVEMIKDPSLKNKPFGVQQKNIVVTSNYTAREFGIKKCMLITEAKKLCPNLLLVNGGDLYDYRQTSSKVSSLLHTFSPLVERLGLDENFIDVTDLVKEKLKISSNTKQVGHKFGETDVLCDCGCTERISVGSNIAQEIRDQIYQELQLTVCAGIAHNKLLAKVAGSKNKPNKQTFVLPNDAAELILSLEFVKNVPWIGYVTAEQLNKINITTVNDLQNCSTEQLKNIFGFEKAENMWNSSFGIDNTPVKKTGKPQSIGLEDSCKAITSEQEVEDKLKCLLRRLMILVEEDERIPKTIKLTVRKLDTNSQTGIRETRQCIINTSLKNEEKVMNIILTLFRKVVDGKKKFHITLLGLAFTKFEEKLSIKNTLTNFCTQGEEIELVNKPSTSLFNTENATSVKQTIDNFVTTNKILETSKLPFKQRVIALKQNSTDSVLESRNKVMCPPYVNEEVFRELPTDIQEEIWNEYKRKRDIDETQRPHKKMKSNSILNYVTKEQK